MFNAGKWVAEIAASLSSYAALQGLILHDETIEFHVSKLPIKTFLSEGYSMDDVEDKKTNAILRKDHINSIRDANQIYRKQMIVLIASYAEAIILDFLQCIFTAHPARAYDYINEDEKELKGKVDLKEILEADTKDALIKSLSIKAANIATRAKFRTSLSNLEKISRQKLNTKISGDLQLIVERRNLLVHELSDIDITNQQVKDGFECLSDLISHLGVIAQENGIHVNNPHLWEEE